MGDRPKPQKVKAVRGTTRNTVCRKVWRIPLGHAQIDPGGTTCWTVWVPTDTGGTLTITHSAGGKLVVKRGSKRPVTRTGKAIIEVPSGEYGEYFIESKSKPGLIGATFHQLGWARVGPGKEAKPLIPYNFWFWPAQTPSDNDKVAALDVIGRCVKVFQGEDAKAVEYEQTFHFHKAEEWEGHCHNAAPASMYFDPPPKKNKKIKGQVFEMHERKLLAAELFGQFGRQQSAWELASGTNEKVTGRDILWFFRPSNFDRDAFVAALSSGSSSAYATAEAEAQVRGFEGTYGGWTGVEQMLRTAAGRSAVGFYGALVEHMREKGHPLCANMRGKNGSDAMPVWNQVCFLYEARYVEHTDENDISIECTLHTNDDKVDDDNPPASIVENRPKPDPAESLTFVYKWRIIFDGKGKFLPGDARCAWVDARRDGASGTEVFVPTELLYGESPRKGPGGRPVPTLSPMEPGKEPLDERLIYWFGRRGNPFIPPELLQYVRIRARYK